MKTLETGKGKFFFGDYIFFANITAMSKHLRLPSPVVSALVLAAVALLQACGGSGSSGTGGGGGGGSAPGAPTGLTATAGSQQVTLSWIASAGATSYHVKRGTATAGPYTQVAAPTAASYVDTSLTNGVAYYYVVSALNANGESGNSSEATATPLPVPPVPTGLSATPGDKQISLTWTASAGATSYNVKRGANSGGPYTTLSSPAGTSYSDTGLTDGTKYFYVVSAVNSAGESGNSSEAAATPVGSATAVQVTVDVLTNRHPISPYIYGGSYPKDAATITDSGLSVVRWGGNATSTYNWQLHTYNADNDYYFEDFDTTALGGSADGDSAQFIKHVVAAGSNPLTTIAMLPWVAKSAETAPPSPNYHWSFSALKYGSQCHIDPFNTDAGDGITAGANCDSSPTYLTANPNDAYFPLLDGPPQGTDPAGSVYRNQWTAALAPAFGTAPHFYNMDNEIDIWGGTHRDIHPNPATYNELRDTYLTESRALKGWDPLAIRLGPVSCCWYFYWRSATGSSETSSHGGVDFLPWWLNEVAWSDAVNNSRSLDIFDIHAYPDGPDTTSFTQAQKQALAVRIYRDWWDSTYTSEASYIANGGFSIEPLDSKPFRIPRMRAIVNQIYPGTLFSITEWSAEFAGAADFSTALGDADAYGILGRERVYLASRWTAPDPANPNYLALKLFTNYDGAHHGFGTTSVSATHNADPNLFSTYAAVDSTGKTLTMMVINKDPANGAQVQFALNGFTPSSVISYTLAATAPTVIQKTSSPTWPATMTFAPYTATLLVITGTTATVPASEWDLNPDTIMVPAGGTVTLQPKIISGTANVTLSSPTSDSGITVALTQPNITTTQNGAITITAGNNPGFYHFTVTGTDTVATQTQGGWIVVGKPAATLTKTGDNLTGGTLTLAATLVPGSSGGTASGASVFFTADSVSATLSSRIATTDSSGKASVALTLPPGTGTVHVKAEGPYGLGHPVATFTETSN